MPEKVRSGALREHLAHEANATGPAYSGGKSRIIVLRTVNGQHIGTIHRIVMPDGSIPHEHPKDYVLRDCSRVRIGEPSE